MNGLLVLHMVGCSSSQMSVAPTAACHTCPFICRPFVRLNLGMSEANAAGSLVVPKKRLRPKGGSDLSADGE